MAYMELPDEAAYMLWKNSILNGATLDMLTVFVARLLAAQTNRPYKDVLAEMEADRDARVQEIFSTLEGGKGQADA